MIPDLKNSEQPPEITQQYPEMIQASTDYSAENYNSTQPTLDIYTSI
jgi:hypothetical protein